MLGRCFRSSRLSRIIAVRLCQLSSLKLRGRSVCDRFSHCRALPAVLDGVLFAFGSTPTLLLFVRVLQPLGDLLISASRLQPAGRPSSAYCDHTRSHWLRHSGLTERVEVLRHGRPRLFASGPTPLHQFSSLAVDSTTARSTRCNEQITATKLASTHGTYAARRRRATGTWSGLDSRPQQGDAGAERRRRGLATE